MKVEIITADSLITLHYRVTNSDGFEFISTFDHRPATLQLGTGELAPPFEQCLIGLPTDTCRSFDLPPDAAFGAHNPDLVQRIRRSDLPDDAMPELLANITMQNAAGQQFTGIVRERDEAGLLVDFNHPLAGKSLRFEVDIKGIL